jgi:hypothetical protein
VVRALSPWTSGPGSNYGGVNLVEAERAKVDVSRDPERRRLKIPEGVVHDFIRPPARCSRHETSLICCVSELNSNSNTVRLNVRKFCPWISSAFKRRLINSYIPTHLPITQPLAYLPTYLSTHPPIHLPSHLTTYPTPIYLPTHPPTYPSTQPLAYLSTHPPAYLPTCPSTQPFSYLLTHSPNYLPIHPSTYPLT